MNRTAERHVTKAKGYLAKGDEFYGKAADEMIAAQKADPTLSYKALAAEFDHGAEWARRLVAWRTNASYTMPFSEPKGGVATRHAKAVLKDAPLEQIETILDQLPRERRQAIGAAAKEAWMSTRQERDERIARRTPEERREVEQAQATVDASMRRVTGGLSASMVVSDLDGATDELKEMAERGELTPDVMRLIDEAHDRFVKELEFAKALIG
jgi:DNA-binding transcriptional MerR regulator